MFFFFLFSCSIFSSIFCLFQHDVYIEGCFFVSYSDGNERVIMCHSFFYEYHFALNMKHKVKIIRWLICINFILVVSLILRINTQEYKLNFVILQ